ncbi:MAG: putative zinc-binding protein [Bacillota bacterium]|nr:putative zinc-binding protein [Bacillota bacterium]
MAQAGEWNEQMVTHQNAIFVCFGGLSNTGYITALAGMEAVRQLGLKKASMFCLAGLPAGIKSVAGKTSAARRVITVDGCPMNCARKVVEKAGFTVDKAITLATDLGVKKIPLHIDLDGEPKEPMSYVDPEDVKRATKAIVDAVEGA